MNVSTTGENVVADILIVTTTDPSVLQKGLVWFREHQNQIKDALGKEGFWQDHALLLRSGESYKLSEILRTLDEFGYEKTALITSPGEFSLWGGVLGIAPINEASIFHIDFLGNTVERITQEPLVQKTKNPLRDLERKLNKESLKNLREGEYLVHLDHGIGKFVGIEESNVSRVSEMSEDRGFREEKYYVLEYAENDKLYVPFGLERKLSRYLGFQEPKISRLGTPLWERTKRKVKEDTIIFATQLLEIYAKREIAERPPYPEDELLEREVAGSFEFEETPDQVSALLEIHEDLSSEKPMDRVICGDVGFGKTEVAIRAAVRVATSGYQVALISPTTILSWQHFGTFTKRLRHLPFRVALLSRIQDRRTQQEILPNIENGTIDIVIGTHRLLSHDVRFKNIGLLIIDEEQKFGVKQKEKFKEMRQGLDILSLSATPIPRTLYLALSALRSLSIITTPPPGRMAVVTYIEPWNEEKMKEAIEKEIARGGQVYFLYNRVETIHLMKEEIERLLPGVSCDIAHGKLDEQHLIETMERFRRGETKVLVATTIIENGLDLANVNTLVVRDATRLGLAQAYQIRGRIGRSNVEAHAYFFHPRRRLGGRALERLTALKEAEALGSGYQVALRDLEIRGAGNILGKEQSGSVRKVGLNLYCQILAETVEELRKPK